MDKNDTPRFEKDFDCVEMFYVYLTAHHFVSRPEPCRYQRSTLLCCLEIWDLD